jgi:hypothetical protein
MLSFQRRWNEEIRIGSERKARAKQGNMGKVFTQRIYGRFLMEERREL